MTTQAEALKLALEVLERIDLWLKARYSGIGLVGVELDAITAIKEALAQLEHEKERCVGCEACIDTACGRDECPKGWPKAAQPEQEPVAWMNPYGGVSLRLFTGLEKNSYTIPLYTTPPQRTWVGLTDEEIDVAIKAAKKVDTGYAGWVRDQRKEYAKAIEAKLKEKNT